MITRVISLIQRPRLQLRWKLLGGFLVANLVLIIALGIALFTLRNTNGSLDRVRNSVERETQVSQIAIFQERLLSSALDATLSRKSSRLIEYNIAGTALDNALKNFVPRPTQELSYTNLKKEITDIRNSLDDLLKAQTDSANTQTALERWQQVGPRQIDQIRSLLQDITQKEKYNVILEYEQTIGQIDFTSLLVTTLSVIALLVAIALALITTAALTQPLSQLKRSLANLAKGDLTNQIRIVNRDELGDLGSTFNTTLDSLANLVKSLYVQSQKVSNATAELTYQANTQVIGSTQQAGAIAEATATIQELSQTAAEITRQASNASASVSRCLTQANAVSTLMQEMVITQERGRSIVARTIEELYNVKEQVAAIDEEQQILLGQSAIIQKVINLLDGISQSTHLLALNASIEAAGAGVYGQRFGVVAREVKGLADRSVQATREVREALNNIANSVQQVSLLSTQCLHEAESAVEESHQCDTALVELVELSQQVQTASYTILDEVKSTAELATNIGAATSQQQIASSQMLEKMLAIDSVTSQNLVSIRQGEYATQELSASARALAQSADNFKLRTAA